MIYSFIYSCNTAGLGFNLKGELYSNNSIVNITDIGNGTNALYCFTNRSGCCRKRDGDANGEWFFPDRSVVEGNGRVSTLDFSRNREPSAVLLNQRNNAMGPIGLYRCEVLDARNVNQSIYVGLYPINGGHTILVKYYYIREACNDNMHTGSLSVSHLSYSRSSHTLNCTSTGGPVVDVIWSKDGVVISPSSPSHQRNQNLFDGSTAIYHNLLSITSSDIRDYIGSFTCTVSNTRGSSLPISLDINGIPSAIAMSQIWVFIIMLCAAISITGNTIFQIGEIARITCSFVVGNVMIQWSRGSDVVAQMSGVQQLTLNFTANMNSNNTEYNCTVVDRSFQESSSITIQVGGDS